MPDQLTKSREMASICQEERPTYVNLVPSVFSVPTVRPASSVPTVRPASSVPSVRPVSSVPTVRQVSSVPTVRQVSSVPTTHKSLTIPDIKPLPVSIPITYKKQPHEQIKTTPDNLVFGRETREKQKSIFSIKLEPSETPTETVAPSKVYQPKSIRRVSGDDVLCVSIDFSDGYTARQMFEFFKAALPCAPLFCSEDGIRIEQSNGDETILVYCFIDKRNIVGYKFFESECNDPENRRHVVSLNLQPLLTQLKSLAKKECLKINIYTDRVEGKFYGGSKSTKYGAMSFVTQDYHPAKYIIDDAVTKDTYPNVTIPLGSFCSVCTNASRSKYPFTYFIVYPEGVRIIANTCTGADGIQDGWGDCHDKIVEEYEDENGELCYNEVTVTPKVTCINLQDTKALTKTSNLQSNGGIVKIYSNKDGLVRLEIPTGVMTTITIILRGRDSI
jgi:hypothetical protein